MERIADAIRAGSERVIYVKSGVPLMLSTSCVQRMSGCGVKGESE